jgi:tRNA nucleotidyltransferase (CCA-adding enzyme)
MQGKIESICSSVLENITPTKKRRAEIESLASELERKVVSASKALGVKAIVRVEGSVAKDTWLSEEPDIDIFIRVPTMIPRRLLGDTCLKVARKAVEGARQVERFAEHPYLEAFVNDVRVNIVPCYDTKRGEWLSATDRTPFHTDYVKKRFSERLKGETRLLKKFMKGIGVYGAEIKVGGFSGYLCELLSLHYESFVDVLKAFAEGKQRLVIDIEGYYERRENELRLLFPEPLVVVDPVDRGRNVASAVRKWNLYEFVAAAQPFLKNPSKGFFDPPKTVPLPVSELRRKLKERGAALVFVTFEGVNGVPDILWGQLYKSLRSLRKLVELNDFSLLREFAWSDEKTLSMFGFELESRCVSQVKKHLGPPLDKEKECEKFVAKYVDNVDAVCGPYVEDGRWVVLVRRKFTDVCELLGERLKDGGKNAGVAEGISHVLKKGFSVLVNEEIVKVYESNSEFAVFLTEFLQGKPKWLESR